MRGFVSTLGLGLALSACAPVAFGSAKIARIDRRGNETFAWLVAPAAAEGAPGPQATVARLIREQVVSELEARGYRYDPTAPDLLVDYHTAAKGDAGLGTIEPSGEYDLYEHHAIVTPPRVGRELAQATLVVDIAEADGRKLVWRGWGSANLAYISEPDHLEERVTKLIKKLVGRFPRHR